MSVSYPCSRLQSGTQRPLRFRFRQVMHMVGPGPQQPSSEHSWSHVRFCCSGTHREDMSSSGGTSTHAEKLTADVGGGDVTQRDNLIRGPEEAAPLVGAGVAQGGAVFDHHPPSAHLLQRAQAQPAEARRPHYRQAVMSAGQTSH